MSDALQRVKDAAQDARSNNEPTSEFVIFDDREVHSQLDTETLDERFSSQMGSMFEPVRRDVYSD